MYSSSKRNPPTPVPMKTPQQQRAQSNYFHTSDALNVLIDLNQTNLLVDKQLKEDTKNFQVAKLTPSVNIII